MENCTDRLRGVIDSGNKFCLLSHSIPPSPSGQAIMLYRLLAATPPEEYCLISVDELQGSANNTSKLLGQVSQIDKPLRRLECLASVSDVFARMFSWWQIKKRAYHIERILREQKSCLLVACSGDLLDIPAGAIAAENLRIPFIPYFFDDYIYQWVGWKRILANELENVAMNIATGAIVPNEFLARVYFERYGIECRVVRNPVLSKSISTSVMRSIVCNKPARIVYTGSVYHAHYDAFCNLLMVLKAHPDLAELHIYTAQAPSELERFGICGYNIKVWSHVNQIEALKIQKEADILFLPLAFSSEISEVLRTSAPGKMGEYLASGVPILVHAPADSFPSWYFKEYKCGIVVDTCDFSLLKHALQQLCSDEKLRTTVINHALKRAEQDFSIETARSSFFSYLNSFMHKNMVTVV